MFTIKESLLRQLKRRRLALGFKQKDMMIRISVSRQQYQRLESKGNPRLNTLELIAQGLNCELMLIPKEMLETVRAVLEDEGTAHVLKSSKSMKGREEKNISDDPWQGLLGDNE